jgi:tetratricopeptide (TPR) repeat protein
MFTPSSFEGQSRQEEVDQLANEREMGRLRSQLAKANLPVEVVSDIALSNMKMSVEGDDTTGYRVVMQGMGAKNQTFFLAQENSKYLLQGTGKSGNELGLVVLQQLQAKNLESARKVLDWARAEIQIASGDDPLAGPAFPHLWTRGDPADAEKMKYAGLSLVSGRADAKKWVPEMVAARDGAKNEHDRTYLEDALTNAYFHAEDWNGVRESALRQLKVYPQSNSTLAVLGTACGHLQDWTTWSKVIEERLAKVSDDPDALRAKAQWYSMQSQFEKAAEISNMLLAHKVNEESIAQARQAVSVDKTYADVHTLAALYAENGNSREARQLLLELMNDNGMEKPDSNLWYVFGRIAENDQQPQAALACYKRVEWKQKYAPSPGDTYVLAQQRLSGLGAGTGVVEAK